MGVEFIAFSTPAASGFPPEIAAGQRPGIPEYRREAQNTPKAAVNPAAAKSYEIVLFLKCAGKSVLPLRRRLRAEKKKSCGQAAPTQGSPNNGVGATP
jgi:hypothetical protein